MHTVRLGLIGLLLAGTVQAANPPSGAPPKGRDFAGRVEQWDAKGHSLVMSVPGSRKYPHPKIVWNTKTTWGGLAAQDHTAKPGAQLRVTAVPQADGTFSATRIDILAPEPRPVKAGAGKAR